MLSFYSISNEDDGEHLITLWNFIIKLNTDHKFTTIKADSGKQYRPISHNRYLHLFQLHALPLWLHTKTAASKNKPSIPKEWKNNVCSMQNLQLNSYPHARRMQCHKWSAVQNTVCTHNAKKHFISKRKTSIATIQMARVELANSKERQWYSLGTMPREYHKASLHNLIKFTSMINNDIFSCIKVYATKFL